jgi:hypothetical protein
MTTLFAGIATAQVKTDFNNHEKIGAEGKYLKSFKGKKPYMIPMRNIRALLAQDSSESSSSEAKPFKIAEALPVDIDVVKESEWLEENGLAYGKFTLVAAGAKSVSVNFDQFFLPEETELFVYSEDGEMITGPITEKENSKSNFWGTWVYKGNTLTVDFRLPVDGKRALKLHISSIAYGYKDLYVTDFGSSSSCNINVLCPAGAGWENQRSSVALILNGNSTALCSGVLTNNTCNQNTPFFLTANHCFDNNVANWKFTFQAFSSTCTPSQNANGLTFNGSTLRARNASSDFCLLELNQLPPSNSGITFSGWSRANTASTSGASITHPRGDIMKIATYNTTITQQTFLGSSDWRVAWASGTVEPGSSGGPLYDANRRIIGQVHGGNPSGICGPSDHAFFGRFDISWTGGGTNATRLSNWLDPTGTGAMTVDARGIGILGPDVICGTAQYSFVGQSVAWSSSNASGVSINPITGAATRVNNFNGQVTITAALNGPCGSSLFQKQIAVGTGVSELTINPLVYCDGRSLIYNGYASVPGATNYHWLVKSGNFSFVSTGFNSPSATQVVWPVSRNQPNTFRLVVTTPCGTLTADDGEYQNTPGTCDEGSQLRILTFPNPSISGFQFEVIDPFDSLSQNAPVQVSVFDRLSRKVLSDLTFRNRSTISTADWQPGIYYLVVRYKDAILRRQIVVERK